MPRNKKIEELERAMKGVVLGALDRSSKVRSLLNRLKARGWKVEPFVEAGVRFSRPPLKRAPRKWGKRDQDFLRSQGIEPF